MDQVTSGEPSGTAQIQPLNSGDGVEELKEKLRKSEERYKTLQGMYNADVKERPDELRQQVAQLSQDMQNFRSENEQLRQENERLKKKPASDDYLRDVRENDPDVAAVIERLERKREEETQSLREEISRLNGTVNQTAQNSQSSAERRFWSDLAKEVSDWEQINADQSWINWLSQREPYARKTRKELIDAAANDLDVESVATFFRDFKKLNKSGQEKLSTQVQPDVGGANPPSDTSDKPTYTTDWIRNFGNKLSMLGRERFKRENNWTEEQLQFAERDIVTAQYEGRIR